MSCSDLILGGTKVLGGEISSCLPLVPNFMSPEGLEEYVQTHALLPPAPFNGLDLSAPTARMDPLGLVPVTVKPLALLLREFQIVRSAGSGKPTYPHGTREFSKARTKIEVHLDERTKVKVKRQIWAASQADLNFHHEQVKSMGLALLLFDQESQGIDSDRLLTRLRFFTEEEARHVLSDRPQKHFLWHCGKARPDQGHLVLILRHETPKSFKYAAFSLVIP